MPREFGKFLIVGGALAVLAGVAIHFGWMSWFGRLPGDIRTEGQGSRVWVPLTSMLLVSLVLSVVLWIVRRIGT